MEALGGLVVASSDGSTSKKSVARVTFSDCIEEVVPTSGNNFVDSEELSDKHQILDRKQERKRNKWIKSRSIKFIGKPLCDVLLKIRGIDELVMAFTDSGCLGLNTCPRKLFERYFSEMTMGIRSSGPASDYQGNSVKTLGEFTICINEIYGFKTRKDLGKKDKWITLTITETGETILLGRFTMKKLGLLNCGEQLLEELEEADQQQVYHIHGGEELPEPPSLIQHIAAEPESLERVVCLVECFSPEWNRIHIERRKSEEKLSNIAKNFEENIRQAREFYRAVKEMEVTRAVNALKSLQEEIALLSDHKLKIIAKYHGTLRGGHIKDRAKLVRKINENEPEENHVTDEEVRIYIKLCPDCQKMTWQQHIPTGYHPKLDTLDPASNYADVLELGQNSGIFVLAVFNALTRKLSWEIIKSQTKEDVAAGLILINSRQMKLSDVQWRSDKQPAFTSSEIQNLLTSMGTDIIFGIPGSHQDQSPVERSFREIRKHLVPILAEIADTYKGNYFEIALAIAFDIYNNIESVVGFAPNEAYSPLFYSSRLRQYLAEHQEEGVTGYQIRDKVVEIQDIIIDKMKKTQSEIFKKKQAKSEGVVNPAQLRKGMYVLLIPEDYDKHEFRKSGAWEVLDIVQRNETGQYYVHLRDPISQVDDFAVHSSRVVPFTHDPRFGDAKAIRAKDLKETVVISIEEHTCTGDERRMADYDFLCLWANGVKSWIPYSEASKLWMFEAYIKNFDEFRNVIRGRQSRRDKKDATPPTIPQRRRRNIQNVYQYTAGKPMEEPGHNSIPVEPPVTHLTADEIIEKIVAKFQLEGEEKVAVVAWFDHLIRTHGDGVYQSVFQPLKPGEFIKTDPVQLRMDPSKEIRSPPPYLIKDPRAVEAYLTYIKKLIMEGRAQQLPAGTEVKVNNPPRMVIDYYMEDGTPKWRFTQDARCRNDGTIKKPFFARQSVTELIQRMSKPVKGICDIKAAFYQLLLDDESRQWTRWICPVTGNIYEMIGMDMGGCNNPSELQDRMDKIFGLIAPYIDDLMNSHDTIEDHKAWIVQVLDLCVQFNIKLSPDKCNFFCHKIETLGRLVDHEIHTLNDETKKKIESAHKPKNVRDLQHFIGMENWARDYLFYDGKFASEYTKPLTEMIHEPKMKWTEERTQAFDTLKLATANCLKLHFFDPSRQIYMAQDASKKGWGAILFYLNEDGSKDIVSVASGSFNETEQKWSTNEHEAKAIHNGLLAFKHYLLGREFILFTDNRNLTFLHNNKSDKVHRWTCDFAQFSFKAYHIPGKFNWETDFLSRILDETNTPTPMRFFDVPSRS